MFTIILFLIIGFYGFARGKIFLGREKPLISTVIEDDLEAYNVYLADHNFMLAWGI
jgi:hypothetical protein